MTKSQWLSELLENASGKKAEQAKMKAQGPTRLADEALAYISGAKKTNLEIYVKWTKGHPG